MYTYTCKDTYTYMYICTPRSRQNSPGGLNYNNLICRFLKHGLLPQ